MEVQRLVEIWNPCVRRAGTGYLVADRLVLTARHNVQGTSALEVRRLSLEGQALWAGAETQWPESGQEPLQVDAALIRITDPKWLPPDSEPVRWGRIDARATALEAQLTCWAVGFPRSEVRDEIRDTKEIRGHIELLTGLKSRLITAYVDRVAVPDKPDGRKSRWEGASGAALFSGRCLIGVITTDRTRDYKGNQLTAVSVAALAASPGFAAAVRSAGADLFLEDVAAAADSPPHKTTAYDIEAPRGLTNLPELPSRIFVGRDEVLAELGRNLAKDSQTITQTLHGLGGVGKTTLALHFGHAHVWEYGLVWWVRSDTPELITTSLAALHDRLRGGAVGGPTTGQRAEWAIGWLQTHPGWLLIFDNVERPEHVAPFTGQLRDSGRYLITSRYRSGWDSEPIALPVLDADASVDLIVRHSGDSDETQARTLADGLGHLPLALEQAGAYVAQNGITLGEYRTRLGQYPERMTDAAPDSQDATRTMARIWRVTLDSLHERDPRAVDILRMAAWYAPTDIPRNLFASLAEDPVDLDQLLGLLSNYNMITLSRTGIDVHRLVQRIARTASREDPHRDPALIAEARDRASAVLKGAIRSDVSGWFVPPSLMPHAEALLEAVDPVQDTYDTLWILVNAAPPLAAQGRNSQFVAYWRRAAKASTRLSGEDDPVTLGLRRNVASAYRHAGDLAQAIQLYKQTLADHVRVLGRDHRETLASLRHLAETYEEAGDLGQAIPSYELALTEYVRVLGEDNTETRLVRGRLVSAREAAESPPS